MNQATPDTSTPARGGWHRSRLAQAVGGTACILALGASAWWWWDTGRYQEQSDDAYVQADWLAVSARIPGYVAEVAVADNAEVKAGDLLLRLDPRDYRQRLRAAAARQAALDAALDAERAHLATFADQLREHRHALEQAHAALQAARGEARRAELDWQRYRQLAAQQAASHQRLERAAAAHTQASAAVRQASAEEQREQARGALLASQRRQAEARAAERQAALEEAAAEVELARNALADTEIRAPFAGRVGQRKVRPRQYVTPGLPLLALVPVEQAYVVANYKETQLHHMRPGQPVTLDVDSSGQRWHGWVDSFSPASGAVFALLPPDNATGNFTKIVQRFPVRIRLAPPAPEQGQLLPGMSVVTSVDTRPRPVAENDHDG